MSEGTTFRRKPVGVTSDLTMLVKRVVNDEPCLLPSEASSRGDASIQDHVCAASNAIDIKAPPRSNVEKEQVFETF